MCSRHIRNFNECLRKKSDSYKLSQMFLFNLWQPYATLSSLTILLHIFLAFITPRQFVRNLTEYFEEFGKLNCHPMTSRYLPSPRLLCTIFASRGTMLLMWLEIKELPSLKMIQNINMDNICSRCECESAFNDEARDLLL